MQVVDRSLAFAAEGPSKRRTTRDSRVRLSVTASGTFDIGGEMTVNRLGFGAMRLTGEGVWGEPRDPDESTSRRTSARRGRGHRPPGPRGRKNPRPGPPPRRG